MESLFSDALQQKLSHTQDKFDFPFRLNRQWGVGYVLDSYSILLVNQKGAMDEVHLPILAFHQQSVKIARHKGQLLCLVVGQQNVYGQTIFREGGNRRTVQ